MSPRSHSPVTGGLHAVAGDDSDVEVVRGLTGALITQDLGYGADGLVTHVLVLDGLVQHHTRHVPRLHSLATRHRTLGRRNNT